MLTIDVDQHVKGGPPKHVVVWTPSGTECDLTPAENEDDRPLPHEARPDGRWVATGASLANPGRLVVVGGEPQGSGIKVVVGLVFLGLVLLWALSRRRRGVRPELPGAPDRRRYSSCGRGAGHALRARARRRRGPDGRRHRAGRRGVRAARLAPRLGARSGRARARGDGAEPGEARGEGRRRRRTTCWRGSSPPTTSSPPI